MANRVAVHRVEYLIACAAPEVVVHVVENQGTDFELAFLAQEGEHLRDKAFFLLKAFARFTVRLYNRQIYRVEVLDHVFEGFVITTGDSIFELEIKIVNLEFWKIHVSARIAPPSFNVQINQRALVIFQSLFIRQRVVDNLAESFFMKSDEFATGIARQVATRRENLDILAIALHDAAALLSPFSQLTLVLIRLRRTFKSSQIKKLHERLAHHPVCAA